VEFEPMDDFERELQVALARRDAPPDLKRKVMSQLWNQASHARHRMVWFERIAASLVLVAVAGGAFFWRNIEDQRRGQEATQQVFTALRITNRALQRMNVQLDEQQER
jgi:hypothetical protein